MSVPEMTASSIVQHANRFREAYYRAMQPLCARAALPPQAVDILMFLANNPGCDTAGDICRCRGLKPGIVSFHVERLTEEGYLARAAVPGDRRKTRLVCTEKTQELIREGRARQAAFARQLLSGLGEETLAQLRASLAAIEGNVERICQYGLSEPAGMQTDETEEQDT